MVRTSTILTATGVTLLTAGVGYAVYFDYKRRSDPQFRKALRKDHKRTHKASAVANARADAQRKAAVEQALREVQGSALPSSVEEKEKYFMEQVAQGEALFAQGECQLNARMSCHRAQAHG